MGISLVISAALDWRLENLHIAISSSQLGSAPAPFLPETTSLDPLYSLVLGSANAAVLPSQTHQINTLFANELMCIWNNQSDNAHIKHSHTAFTLNPLTRMLYWISKRGSNANTRALYAICLVNIQLLKQFTNYFITVLLATNINRRNTHYSHMLQHQLKQTRS